MVKDFQSKVLLAKMSEKAADRKSSIGATLTVSWWFMRSLFDCWGCQSNCRCGIPVILHSTSTMSMVRGGEGKRVWGCLFLFRMIGGTTGTHNESGDQNTESTTQTKNASIFLGSAPNGPQPPDALFTAKIFGSNVGQPNFMTELCECVFLGILKNH